MIVMEKKAASHSHAHHHHHGHGHSHAHAHGVSERMSVAFFLNLSFAIIELIGGLYTNSLAILSDAFHDLGDALAIGLAWFLEKKSQKGSTEQYSYGYRRWSVMAAFITGIILLLGSGAILVKAVPRLFEPEQADAQGMLLLAILGMSVNGFAAYRMSKGSSLNERMILWHLLEDVMGWVVIFIGSILMMLYPIPILDPIMAIGVAVWVIWNVFKNMKDTVNVFLQATPDQVQIESVKAKIKEMMHVKDVHHLHLWSIDGLHHVLTTHLIVTEKTSMEEAHQLKLEIKKQLFDDFHITEATIEIEWPHHNCADPKH